MKRRSSGPVRYATYLRCSTDDQKHGDFTTIDTQRELNVKHVCERGGILVKEYADEGRSGTNLKRPGWQELVRDAEADLFDAVCATYMSRIARGEAYHIAEYLLSESDVKIELIREHFTCDLAGHVNKQMTILMDGMYPKMVSQWTRTKMEQMVARGYCCGGVKPYGYRAEFVTDANGFARPDKDPPKRLVVCEPEAEAVRNAYALLLKTRSLAAVRNYLNLNTDRQWTTTKTKYLLTQPVYLGVLVFGEWRNDSAHDPIVERDVWEAVQDVFSTRAIRRIPEVREFTYYLQGKVKCPHCACAYSPASAKGGKVHYYACLQGMKRLKTCPVGRVNAEGLHEAILNEIGRAAKHSTVMHRIIADSGGWAKANDELLRQRGELGKKKQFVEVQISNLTRAIEAGSQNFRSLVSRLGEREAERENIIRQIARLDRQAKESTVVRPTAAQVQEVWAQVDELWADLTEEERLQLLSGIVRRVEVKTKDRVLLDCLPIAENHGPKFATRIKWERVCEPITNYPTLRIECTLKPRPRGRLAKAA